MTTTFKNNSSHPTFRQLGEIVENDKLALTQLLLALSTNNTLNRIVRCPTFPAKVFTRDLADRIQLFHKTVTNPYDVSNLLSFLFEHATDQEYRKNRGQFFTPQKIAEEAITHLSLTDGQNILEPGTGTGIFPITINKLFPESANSIQYIGVENDPLLTLCTALSLDWVKAPNSWKVLYGNFLELSKEDFEQLSIKRFDLVISNPPFVRSHRLGKRNRTSKSLGLSNLAGLHSYFLARAASFIDKGKMLFILPSEMRKTAYGTKLFSTLEKRFDIDEMGIYNVNNYYFIDKKENLQHLTVNSAASVLFFDSTKRRDTISPLKCSSKKKIAFTLNDIACVHRGISTGANAFFALNKKAILSLAIPNQWTKKIMPTKVAFNFDNNVLTEEMINYFIDQGKPCYLLSIDPKIEFEDLPPTVKQYIRNGEELGLHKLTTMKAREHWYIVKCPQRTPDLLFTYMFRGTPKFVVNEARVSILTNLLGVYLKYPEKYSFSDLVELTKVLNSSIQFWLQEESEYRLYSGGLMKFEPGDLGKMPVYEEILGKLNFNKAFGFSHL